MKGGLVALERGDWQGARQAFELELRDGEHPEALEGLALAAWWLDLADVVFDARERAYRGYLDRGDRLKFPANYVIPAHSHPSDENVAVVSGQLFIGMGTKVDKTSAHALSVGGYALMPANANHFAYTTGETTIVLSGQGPVEFKYVNPGDDPRNASSRQGRK